MKDAKFEGIGWYYKFKKILLPENLYFGNRQYKNELKNLNSLQNFLELRNLMLMTIVPKKLNAEEIYQSAYLRSAIARVRFSSC